MKECSKGYFMMNMLVVWFLSAFSLYLTAMIVPGFRIATFGSALIAAIVVGILNMFLKPILFILTLPINIITLGLFSFVLTAIVLKLSAAMLKGFEISGWIPAIFGAVVLAIVQILIHMIVGSPTSHP